LIIEEFCHGKIWHQGRLVSSINILRHNWLVSHKARNFLVYLEGTLYHRISLVEGIILPPSALIDVWPNKC
jgi:hypothetical protein